MISHVSHVFDDLNALDAELCRGAVAEAAKDARSILVQVYSSKIDPVHIRAVTDCITKHLPQSVVVGATTVGEIADGRMLTNQTIIGFTFFASSGLTVFALPCELGVEKEVGVELARRLSECPDRIAGVLLLASTVNMDAMALLHGLNSGTLGYPVFGGGAASYTGMENPMVFTRGEIFHRGAIVVALTGDDLHVEAQTYLGWRPLSRPMRVTEVDGLLVKRINDAPAFDIYQHYLGIPNDEHFFLNAMEFPLLIERDGMLLARTPATGTDEGGLQFASDIAEGEMFRLGYGNPRSIIEDAKQVHRALTDFGSQVNLLYSCCCRRFLMQQDAGLETLPFETSAPTFGFYTYGEFYGIGRLTMLNATMVAVGLREGAAPALAVNQEAAPSIAEAAAKDPYANKHARIIARLTHFIEAVTNDLEAANHEITRLSLTDRLTQLPNRARLDQVLSDNLELAMRYGDDFSVVLFDIDNFKQVNDTHGHLAGDTVLIEVGQILAQQTRATDTAGRWGGEEFLVVAPRTPLHKAAKLAEKLRARIASTDFTAAGHLTISVGVAAYTSGDDLDKLLSRADSALYRAKRSGRNRVELGHLQDEQHSSTTVATHS